nr:LOW QUALITY PROTEIN: protein wntless-like [Maniola hyperantus]
MEGTIIENLSGKKLPVLVTFLLLCQIICFLVGGLVAPVPANAQTILGTVCKDTSEMENDTTQWFYNRGAGKCESVDLDIVHHDVSERDIVFTFQMPVPRDFETYYYSRWQQYLIGVLQVDISYHSQMEVTPRSTIIIDARLAYRNKGDPDDAWKLYAQSIERRDCDIDIISEKYLYDCSPVPLFELGSLYHDYYLLNLRLPVNTRDMNAQIGHIKDTWVTLINQNGDFTKVWLSLKTAFYFFPCIIATLVWFWRRVYILERKPVLLEKMMLSLGIALCFLNAPIEYLTLQFDLPFMLVLEDIRQVIFYAMLFSFWLVFAGEHMVITAQSSLKYYWRHLTAVAMGCISLLIFDMCERGVHLRNPFYIWVADLGTKALIFIILAIVYFLFLCYMFRQVFLNIYHKHQSLPSMCSVRGLHAGVINYRFIFMMLATLVCAALTVIGFILGQMADGLWKWDVDNIQFKHTSALFTGVYGMWNIYIISLLVLYAPSHKCWPDMTQGRSEILKSTSANKFATVQNSQLFTSLQQGKR